MIPRDPRRVAVFGRGSGDAQSDGFLRAAISLGRRGLSPGGWRRPAQPLAAAAPAECQRAKCGDPAAEHEPGHPGADHGLLLVVAQL